MTMIRQPQASGEKGYLALADGTVFTGVCFGALRSEADSVC